MALLYGRAERLTVILGGFRPGQWHGLDVREQLDMQKGSPRRTSASFGSGGTGRPSVHLLPSLGEPTRDCNRHSAQAFSVPNRDRLFINENEVGRNGGAAPS
jgi:hypothetical protein